jgi:adenosine deaminase
MPTPRAALDALPKVELHLHLEGAIPLDALWELLVKYGGDPEVTSREALARRFRFRDFAHFIQTWVWKNGFLREYDDFELIAEAVAADLARQNMRYAEVHYSPPDFERHGLEVGRLTRAIRRGLDRVSGIRVGLIADLVRDFGAGPRAQHLVDALADLQELGVIGIGLGGSEHDHPPEPFAHAFERARRHGLHTTAHAGEASGAASVWGALRALRVERIGHGTRAGEDPALLAHLAERGIPLEMCPLSNVRTGVVGSVADHPIRRYVDAGLTVTLSTDDPVMFGNTLVDELAELESALSFTPVELKALIRSGIRASWLDTDAQSELERTFEAEPAWRALPA